MKNWLIDDIMYPNRWPAAEGWNYHGDTKYYKSTKYPPHNIIEVVKDSKYIIELAVAGFAKEDITATLEGRLLTITGSSKSWDELNKDYTYLHKGISSKDFKKVFELASGVEITAIALRDGLLFINLKTTEEKTNVELEIK